MSIRVTALYHFSPIPDPVHVREHLQAYMARADLRGTLLVATEGINGTVAGKDDGINQVLAAIKDLPGFSGIVYKDSWATEMPFKRAKVKLKREIVTLGVPGVDPSTRVGTYVAPADWNALIERDDVILVDTRNSYEYHVGTFENAINPETTTFREFPDWVKENLSDKKDRPIAMFCTGGIRCEKATSYLLQEGYEQVYHLKGGILKYLEEVDPASSRWEGECFVFDERVTVKHGLEPGTYAMCHACRMPLTPEELAHERYEAGVACPYCAGHHSEAQLAHLRERQHQVTLAAERGEVHMGHDARAVHRERKREKWMAKEDSRRSAATRPTE